MAKLKQMLLARSIGLYLNLLGYVRPGRAQYLAYKFFSHPRAGKLHRNQLPEVLLPALGKTLEVNGRHMQTYVWPGNDHIILLVHGWESNTARWAQLLPYLQQSGSTIVAIDAPAHGLSSGLEFTLPAYAEFIAQAVQTFQPQVLIGHSIGGAACMYHQYLHPEQQVHKMVLLGAPSDLHTITGNFARILGLGPKTRALFEQYFVDHFNMHPTAFSASVFGPTVRAQGFIAHDQDDDVVAFSEGEKIATYWKHAHFIQTKGLGHSMHDADLYGNLSRFIFS